MATKKTIAQQFSEKLQGLCTDGTKKQQDAFDKVWEDMKDTSVRDFGSGVCEDSLHKGFVNLFIFEDGSGLLDSFSNLALTALNAAETTKAVKRIERSDVWKKEFATAPRMTY